MHYQKLKEGWDKAAAQNTNAAIHPAGNVSPSAYNESGIADLNKLLRAMQTQGIGPEALKDLFIIDYGCGNGRMATPLHNLFGIVYAVDLSYAMLQQLPEYDNLVPVLVNDNIFIVPGDKANVAVSVSVFIHNTYEDGVAILKQISANLVPGGFAFLQIPIYDERREPNSWADVGVWTDADLHSAAISAGMEVVATYANLGVFSFHDVGPLHAEFQILQKIKNVDDIDDLEF